MLIRAFDASPGGDKLARPTIRDGTNPTWTVITSVTYCVLFIHLTHRHHQISTPLSDGQPGGGLPVSIFQYLRCLQHPSKEHCKMYSTPAYWTALSLIPPTSHLLAYWRSPLSQTLCHCLSGDVVPGGQTHLVGVTMDSGDQDIIMG